MTTRVIDASVVVKWVVKEEDSDRAIALLEGDDLLIAPDWLLVEAANILWKRVRRGELTAHEAEVRLRILGHFAACLVPAAPLVSRALDLSTTLGHPVYDLVYLALAEREAARLITADERFCRAVMNTRWAPMVELL